jgi:regulator of nucleoside diphosphate kinase
MALIQSETTAQSGAIYVTDSDMDRLLALLEGYRLQGREDRGTLQRLEEELDRAVVVDAGEIPPDVVTLDSRVLLFDLDSREELLFTLVLPSRSNIDEGRISVLAPLGMAVLGYRVGNDIEWEVPAGRRRLRVQSVIYQPEAAGRQPRGLAGPRPLGGPHEFARFGSTMGLMIRSPR